MAFERITVEPNRMRGLPCIRDTRATVSAVLGQLAAGRTVEKLLQEFPYLEREDSWPPWNGRPRRLRIENSLSPRRGEIRRRRQLVARGRRRACAAGHDAVHVADIGLLTASDEAILAAAAEDDRVILSADADFAALLALGHLSKPSFILLRSADLTSSQQADLLLATSRP